MKKLTLQGKLLLGAALLSISAGAQDFPRIAVNIGVHLIQAELAATPETRARGLMYRENLGQNEGMVFRFPAPRRVCMWMKNTLIPLSVAFIGEDGRIVNIEDMQPQTTDEHCSQQTARYALEMRQGWFKQRNIKGGELVSGLPK
ncbi:MAG: hypothetical protein RL564_451 [Pseudomonadota bacterium]|jgi:uncharacterized membrane protein (UPF0127 family)